MDIPRIKSRISSQIRGKLVEGHDRLLIQGTKIGDIAFIKRLRIVGEHDATIVSYGRDRNAGAIAPEKLLLFLGRAISLLLVGAAFDPQPAIRIASQSFGFVVALLDIDTPIVFLDPGVNVLDIEGDDFPEPGDFFFEIASSGSKKRL